MVKLLEYEGKDFFKKYGIPVPSGYVVKSVNEIQPINFAMVIKAQVLTGGRGKRGGILKVSNLPEARKALDKISTINFDGHYAKQYLVESAVNVVKELYISITLDRSKRLPILMASTEGGMEIENVPDEKILKYYINPFIGVSLYIKRELAKELKIDKKMVGTIYAIVDGLWNIFKNEDAELVEINPLGVTEETLVAMDAKVVIEDDALFRHKNIEKVDETFDELEAKAREKSIAFVKLDGNIGVIANGAGLTMATLDTLTLWGGKPGVFLDLGGTDDPAKVTEAFELMCDAEPNVVFVNIFGGVTRCDTVATGLVNAIKNIKPKFPIVARIRGFHEVEGRDILKKAGISSFLDMKEAAKNVVDMVGGGA